MSRIPSLAILAALSALALGGCVATVVGTAAGTAVGATAFAVKTTGKVAGKTAGAAAHAVHHRKDDWAPASSNTCRAIFSADIAVGQPE